MASYLPLTPYLRNDLYCKEQINYAETLNAVGPSDFIRAGARVYFIKAALIGTVEAVVHTLVTALLFLPHVISSGLIRFVGWKICKGSIRQFNFSLGRAQGAWLAIGVALISTLFTEASHSFRTYLEKHLKGEWTALMQTTTTTFGKRVQNALQRLAPFEEHQQYRLFRLWTDTNNQQRTDRSWLALRFDQMEKRIKGFCNETKIDAVPEEMYERFETAREDLNALVSDKTRKLSSTPITYTQIAAWKVARADRLKAKAVKAVWEQAERIANKYTLFNPKKFDRSAYMTAVQQYAASLEKKLSGAVEQLQKRKETVVTQWKEQAPQYDKEIAQLAAAELSIVNEQKRLQWWIDTRWPLMRLSAQQAQEYQDKIDALEGERSQKLMQLQSYQQKRNQNIYSIKMGAFASLEKNYFSFLHRFNGLVNGEAISRLESLAQPSWYTRVWRPISKPIAVIAPGTVNTMNHYLDPDVSS